MAAGMAVGVAAPAVAAVGLGYGTYKLAQNNDIVREGLTKASDLAGGLASKGAETASQVTNAIAPAAKDAAEMAGEIARRGLITMLSSVEAGAAALKKKIDGDER